MTPAIVTGIASCVVLLGILVAVSMRLHRTWLRVRTLEAYLANSKADHADTRRHLDAAHRDAERLLGDLRTTRETAEYAVAERDRAVAQLAKVKLAARVLRRARTLAMTNAGTPLDSRARAAVAQASSGVIEAALDLLDEEPAKKLARDSADAADEATIRGGAG